MNLDEATIRRYWKMVVVRGADDCWEWVGAKSVGYGRFKVEGRLVQATHVALNLDGRPIESGLFACHHCDNPKCVNPKHLFIGTRSDNMMDCSRKGRLASPRLDSIVSGEKVGTSKLSNAEAQEMKARRANGTSTKELSAIYGLHITNVRRVLRGATYRNAG